MIRGRDDTNYDLLLFIVVVILCVHYTLQYIQTCICTYNHPMSALILILILYNIYIIIIIVININIYIYIII